MGKNSNHYLGTERTGKLMKQYAVPCIISLLVGALYNIVDQIFIAILAVWYLLNMKVIRPSKADYGLDGFVCGRTLLPILSLDRKSLPRFLWRSLELL